MFGFTLSAIGSMEFREVLGWWKILVLMAITFCNEVLGSLVLRNNGISEFSHYFSFVGNDSGNWVGDDSLEIDESSLYEDELSGENLCWKSHLTGRKMKLQRLLCLIWRMLAFLMRMEITNCRRGSGDDFGLDRD